LPSGFANAPVAAWAPPAPEFYPEQADPSVHWLDTIENIFKRAREPLLDWTRRRELLHRVRRVNALEPDLRCLPDSELDLRVRRLRPRLRLEGYAKGELAVESFALLREVSRRMLGLRHHDVQLLAGFAMLDGSIIEMDTGEGKTLTAGLTAATAAMAGMSVHIITVNDYLAGRDHDFLRPVYLRFGLTTGVICHEVEHAQRPSVYARDIVYASNKEIAFDYLRDRIVIGGRPRNLFAKLRRLAGGNDDAKLPVMRGLHFAIVDEADSVLVDEARTPLIISRETDAAEEQAWAEEAFRLVDGFTPDLHFRLIVEDRRIELTDAGRSLVGERAEVMGGIWNNRVRREEAARQALIASLLFRSGEHYLVSDGKVQIIDEYSGRLMPDRSWSEGLHQLIELKEGCKVTGRKQTIARMTYQRFFRRYLHLSGMTGTAREVRSEFRSVYRVAVFRVPPNVPSEKRDLGSRICPTLDDKWQAIVQRTAMLVAEGRPVLIATRSVNASHAVSQCLSAASLEHTVLNAEQSAEEADIIARAGESGCITVATNMAGRGVDIKLDPEVVARGGLHVILSERHDAGRIDRQMEGRAGRRGEAGTTEKILSLEDPLLDLVPLQSLRRAARVYGQAGGRALFSAAQWRAEQVHSRDRKALLAQDRRLGVLLAFSGGSE
jgi:preprotein translocase subunit SecA